MLQKVEAKKRTLFTIESFMLRKPSNLTTKLVKNIGNKQYPKIETAWKYEIRPPMDTVL